MVRHLINGVGRHIYRYGSLESHQIRHYSFSWFKSPKLSPFSKIKSNVNSSSISPSNNIIIEDEPTENTTYGPYLIDFKHYLSANIADNLRNEILKTKLSQFADTVVNFKEHKSIMVTLNKVFLKLYELNNKSLEGILSPEDQVKFFKRSTLAFTQSKAQDPSLQVPPFLVLLSRLILQNKNQPISPELSLYVVVLGSEMAHTTFENSIYLFFKNRSLKISPDAMEWFLKYLIDRGKLTTSTFEKIYQASIKTQRTEMLTNAFFNYYIKYVDNLFDTVPETHEYKNKDKNLDYIRYLTSNLAQQSINLNIDMGKRLAMAKLCWELESVNVGINDTSQKSYITILSSLINNERELNFQAIREEIFKQDLDDESLVDSLLSISMSSSKLKSLSEMLYKFVEGDDIKFSPEIRFKAFCMGLEGSESEIYDQVVNKMASINRENIDLQTFYTNCVEALVCSNKVSPNGHFTSQIRNYFQSEHFIDPSIYCFKHRIDSAIKNKNFTDALNIFNDSVDNFIWPSELDPMVRTTMNNLIILGASTFNDTQTFSKFFKQVKKQMVNCKCDAASINAVAQTMLKGDHIGDVYVLLRRELPKFKKDEIQKIPLEGAVGARYKPLFESINNYVLSYMKGDDQDLEDIWVIYGELHRYFKVPAEYYLPAMKYFCKRDRLNAALIIFRQMLRYHELHVEEQRIDPPSREIYLYLLNEFGEQLYEEGVVEVHKILKMDINMPQQDIEMQNCILNAYSNLQNVEEVKNIFLSMTTVPKSIGGINEESIKIMIKTLTYSNISYVKQFWNNLSQYEIPINYDIYKQYLIAHAYHGQQKQAFELVKEMPEYELSFSEDTLLALYNYSLHPEDQDLVKSWAQKQYPLLWNKATKSGKLKPIESQKNPLLITE